MKKISLAALLALPSVLAKTPTVANPLTYIYTAIIITAIISVYLLVGGAEKIKSLDRKLKKILFLCMTIPILLSTVYLGAFTVHKNIVSETKGPVHWHIDYQIWVCDERLDLKDPVFPRNKIGTPILHEHNDDRVHVEGTLMKKADANLGVYFDVIDGKLTDTDLAYDTVNGMVAKSNGDECNGVPSTLKVFINGERITDAANYLMYPHPLVPPGDCAIIEFSPGDAQSTDKICESWKANGWSYENFQQKREAKEW